MILRTQKDGTPLTDAEKKELTALLVKMGYTVRVSKKKKEGASVMERIIEVSENDQR